MTIVAATLAAVAPIAARAKLLREPSFDCGRWSTGGDCRPQQSTRLELIALDVHAQRQSGDLSALNRELQRSGYSTVAESEFGPGFGISGSVSRVRLALEIMMLHQTVTNAAGTDTGVHRVEGGLMGAYDVVQQGLFALYPLALLYFGEVSVDLRPGAPALFREQVGWLREEREAVSESGAFGLGLGLGQAIPLMNCVDASCVLTLGIRAGRLWQFSQGSWEMRLGAERVLDLQGGPRYDLGGPFVTISVGFGIAESRIQ